MARTRGTKNNTSSSKRRGGNKPKKNPPVQPQLPKSNPYQQAQRDWEYANEPLLEDIASEQNRALDERHEMNNAYGNIHQGLMHDLKQTPWGKYDQIANTLTEETNPLMTSVDAFGGAANEQGAWQGAFAAAGNGAQAALAGIQARDVAFTNSVMNQADVDLATRRSNLVENYRDVIAQLQEERRNILEDRGREVAGFANDYRQQRFENQLSLGAYNQSQKEARSNRKATQSLIEYLQSQQGGGGGGGGKPWWKDEAKDANSGTPDTPGGGGKPWWKDEADAVDSGGGNNGRRRTKGELNQLVERQTQAIQRRGAEVYGRQVQFAFKNGLWYVTGSNKPVTDSGLLKLLNDRKKQKQKIRRRSSRPTEPGSGPDYKGKGK